MSIRSSNYSHNEDVLLCEVYKQISQDPAIGKDQSSKAFWARVEEGFNASKDDAWETRSARSLEARIQIIEKAVRKFHGCIRTSEALRRSGTNNEDVMKKAIELFTEDPKYKKGWKFHHVWSTIGDFEKFKDCSKGSKKKMRNHNSSASENEIPDPQDSQVQTHFWEERETIKNAKWDGFCSRVGDELLLQIAYAVGVGDALILPTSTGKFQKDPAFGKIFISFVYD